MIGPGPGAEPEPPVATEAEAEPDAVPEPVAPPEPPTYDLPTARRVVGAGLQLAVASAVDLRRASIYIGLLALAAFGPTIAFAIAAIDHFDLDLAVLAEEMLFGDGRYLLRRPELVGPLLVLVLLGGSGLALLFAISVDAQVIAIAILAGRAAARTVHLPEAIWRARQVFWRMVGGSLLVGLYSTFVQIVVEVVLNVGPPGTNPALDFIVAMLATLATVPFAYLATGIVLGDVGPIEALRRSTRLVRARPTIAVVVVLFTLVTAALEVFALGAGLDLVGWAADVLGLDAAAGGLALVAPIVLTLVAITAFGSLLFTIAALVSAPQVAAFLGLTFYAAGLDRARADGTRPPGFRWVTRPMLVALVLLALVAGLAMPTLAFGPRPATSGGADGPLVAYLRASAERAGDELLVLGAAGEADDAPGDQAGPADPIVDIVRAEYVVLDTVPDWLLDAVFPCGSGTSVCGAPDTERWPYEDGALLYLQRLVEAPDVRDIGVRGNWGPLLALDGFDGAPEMVGTYLADVSDSFLTRVSGGVATIHHRATEEGQFGEYSTAARSAWVGSDLLTLIPISELPAVPLDWDLYAGTDSDGVRPSHDTLRPSTGGPMVPFAYPATIVFSPPVSEPPGG